MALIDAHRKDTGETVRIPEHWIGHPELGEPFTTSPEDRPAKTAERPAARRRRSTPKTPRPKAADQAPGISREASDDAPAAGDHTNEE